MKKLLTLSAVLALTTVTVGQTIAPSAPTPFSGPVTNLGAYNVATQSFFAPVGTATIVYDNSTGNGSFFAPGAGLANMDWGTLAAGGNNDITTFQIGYATSQFDPLGSGTVSLTVSLHEGATGFGDDGTTITSFNVTNLPGSVSGGPEGYVVDVTLPGPVKLPDGPIGYSYEANDATTGPLTIGPPNELDVVDAFDQYAGTGGALVGTFFFGGAPFASFHAQLSGVEPECFLVIGDDTTSSTYQFKPDGHEFNTQVGEVQDAYEVLLTNIPDFQLPKAKNKRLFGSGAGVGIGGQATPDWLIDGKANVQVVMWNPGVFPNQPEQFTAGLKVTVKPDGTVIARPYGPSIGMDIWAETGVDANGKPVIRFPFSIDGL